MTGVKDNPLLLCHNGDYRDNAIGRQVLVVGGSAVGQHHLKPMVPACISSRIRGGAIDIRVQLFGRTVDITGAGTAAVAQFCCGRACNVWV